MRAACCKCPNANSKDWNPKTARETYSLPNQMPFLPHPEKLETFTQVFPKGNPSWILDKSCSTWVEE